MPIEFEQHLHLNLVVTDKEVSMGIVDTNRGVEIVSFGSPLTHSVRETMKDVTRNVMAQLIDIAMSKKDLMILENKLQIDHENRKS